MDRTQGLRFYLLGAAMKSTELAEMEARMKAGMQPICL